MAGRQTGRGVASLRLDVAGVVLAVGMIVWIYWSAFRAGGEPDAMAALVAASAAAFCAARVVAPRWPLIVPAAIVVAAAALFIRSPRELLSPFPLDGPFGYTNSEAAFCVVAAMAALMVSVQTVSAPVRILAFVLSAGLVAIPIVGHSYAAPILFLPAPIVAVVGRGPRVVRTVILAGAILVLVALGATVAAGSSYSKTGDSGVLGRLAITTLTETRPFLWSEALDVMADHPVIGAGPGRFPEFNPIADRDPAGLLRNAHHEFLQQGAETGLMGMVLLVALVLWSFLRLWSAPEPNEVTALGGVALAALAIHSTIDYVLHSPAVPIAAAALIGVGVAGRAARLP